MSVKTSNDLNEFAAFYQTNRDFIDFKEKEIFDRLLREQNDDNFQWKLIDTEDRAIMLSVKWGRGDDLMCKACHIYKTQLYRNWRQHDAVEMMEKYLDNGMFHEADRKLPLCVNALLGIVDDGVAGELYLSITEKDGLVTGVYASAFNDMIIIEY
jgi:hypothetical protein